MNKEIDWQGIAKCWETLVKENQKQAKILRILKSQTPDRKINIIGLKNFPKYHDGRQCTFEEATADYGFIEGISEPEFKAIMEWLEEGK